MKSEEQHVPTLEEKYIGTMVLCEYCNFQDLNSFFLLVLIIIFFSGAVGDAIGYKNGSWEFCHNGRFIHNELESLGGLENLCIDKTNWRVSDDTVMHIATAEALVDWQDTVKN
jgi:ADP-ribosylarginine hydrolase